MTPKQAQRQTAPLVITVLGAALYVLVLWTAAPDDLPGYWDAFFRLRTGQIIGLIFATCFYVAGLGLCIVAFSSLLPIRSNLVRRLLSIPGALSVACGAFMLWLVLASFIDKVR